MNNSREQQNENKLRFFTTQSNTFPQGLSILQKSGVINDYEERFNAMMSRRNAHISDQQRKASLHDLSGNCELIMRQIRNTHFKLPLEVPSEAVIASSTKSPMREWRKSVQKFNVRVSTMHCSTTNEFTPVVSKKLKEISEMKLPGTCEILVPCLSNTICVKAQALEMNRSNAMTPAKNMLHYLSGKVEILFYTQHSVEDLYDMDPNLHDYPHTKHLPDGCLQYRSRPSDKIYAGFTNDILGILGRLRLYPTTEIACQRHLKFGLRRFKSKVEMQTMLRAVKISAMKAYRAMLKLVPLEESETSFYGGALVDEGRRAERKINDRIETRHNRQANRRNKTQCVRSDFNENAVIDISLSSNLTLTLPPHLQSFNIVQPSTKREIDIAAQSSIADDSAITIGDPSPQEMESLSIKRAAHAFVDSVLERDAKARSFAEDLAALWRIFDLKSSVDLFVDRIMKSKSVVPFEDSSNSLSEIKYSFVDFTAVAELIATEAYKPHLTQKYIIEQFTRYLLQLAREKQRQEEYKCGVLSEGEFDSLEFKDM